MLIRVRDHEHLALQESPWPLISILYVTFALDLKTFLIYAIIILFQVAI
jgi:hypothetical protein